MMAVAGLVMSSGDCALAQTAAGDAKSKPLAASSAFVVTKDNKGREWQLENWKEGTAKFPAPEDSVKYREWQKDATRPYPKDLKAREEWYLKKNGENWDGARFSNRILTPGDWKWETVLMVPDELHQELVNKGVNPPKTWAGCWPKPQIFAPGAGEVTDIYGGAFSGYVHYNPKTKKVTFIGAPKERGQKDGYGRDARMDNGYGDDNASVDNVTGRIYWVQGGQRGVLRYVEKLLPYKDKADGKEYLLPAILDHKEAYKKVKSPTGGELEPVMKDGQRADPTFAVKTVPGIKNPQYPGAEKGLRALLTPDGKGIWLATSKSWPPQVDFDKTALFEIETGNKLEPLKLATTFPGHKAAGDGVGGHGGTCVGIDGVIYVCEHTGCIGGPCRLLSVDPFDGKVTHLYDSVMGTRMGKWGDRHVEIWDGPADAETLTATSTLLQTQCPRTGAVLNGGWDASGLRHYKDGFLTSMLTGLAHTKYPRPNWQEPDVPQTTYHNSEPAIAPNGDLYFTDPQTKIERIWRMYRTDWPKEQPEYGYGEKHMPRAKLEELMLEYAKKYIANYEANSKF